MIKSFEEYPKYFYTGFFIRLFAFLIDLIMIGSIERISLFFLDKGVLRSTLSLMIYILYFILITKFTNGQTIGKIIFGIRVIALNEKKLSWKTVIVREGFGRYLQKVFLILCGLVIFTPYKQHFVDLLTDTSVLNLNSLRQLKDCQNINAKFFDNEMLTQ